MLKLLIGCLGISGLIYLALCGWLWQRQRWLMYLPTLAIEATPDAVGLFYEEVWISVTSDQPGDQPGTLHGWWIPSEQPQSLTFLYLHGNAGNISTSFNLDRIRHLHALGAAVLMVDYRGYGLSSSPFPNEARFYEDAQAAYQFLHQQKGVDPRHLVLYGHSLGGAIAIQLASHRPQLAGLVVESSFTSMEAMATRSGYNRLFPVRWLLTQSFPSITRVQQLQVPVFYLHGLADLSVPAEMSQYLYEATASSRDLWLVPNADHNDIAILAGDEFEQRLSQFLSDHVLVNQAG